jgi:hypothetical protein
MNRKKYSSPKSVVASLKLFALGEFVIEKKTKCMMHRYSCPNLITLVLYIGSLPNVTTWFPCGRGRTLFILGSKVKVTVTINRTLFILGSLPLYRLIIYIDERILWCTHFLFGFIIVVKLYFLPQGNHVVTFGKDPIYRTNVIVRKRPCCQIFYL